jgi:hypothetical protein
MSQTHQGPTQTSPAQAPTNGLGTVALIAGTLIVFFINASPVWVRLIIAIVWFSVLVAVTAIVVRAVSARRRR